MWIILFVLLFAPSAWAEAEDRAMYADGKPVCPGVCYIIADNCNPSAPVGSMDCRYTVYVKPDSCLAKMEAAMRAMEFWSLLTLPDVYQITLDVVQPDQYHYNRLVLPEAEPLSKYTPYGLTQTEQAKAGRAIVLWDIAKRECWRMP